MKLFFAVFILTLIGLLLCNRDKNRYIPPTPDQLSVNQFIPAPTKPQVAPEQKKEASKPPSKYSVWSLTGTINSNRQSTPIPYTE